MSKKETTNSKEVRRQDYEAQKMKSSQKIKKIAIKINIGTCFIIFIF